MAYLFDTDAISEVLRRVPLPTYLDWLRTVPREDQFTSAICIGEMFRGAYRSPHAERHLANIRERVLPAVTTLPFDVAIAQGYGHLRARLETRGQTLPDADVQIAATAMYHDLELVSGNVKHFERIEGLRLSPVLAGARGDRG